MLRTIQFITLGQNRPVHQIRSVWHWTGKSTNQMSASQSLWATIPIPMRWADELTDEYRPVGINQDPNRQDPDRVKINKNHDDVIKWKHFPRYWPFVRRIHRSPVNSPHKGQWRGALMFYPNKRLSKQWWGWWFETPLCPLWRHRNAQSNFPGDSLTTMIQYFGNSWNKIDLLGWFYFILL